VPANADRRALLFKNGFAIENNRRTQIERKMMMKMCEMDIWRMTPTMMWRKREVLGI
jgi:hypothetical protein